MRIRNASQESFSCRPLGLFERYCTNVDYNIAADGTVRVRRRLTAPLHSNDILAFLSSNGRKIVFVWVTRSENRVETPK